MGFIKKSLCGIIASVFLCGMSSAKALDYFHFDKLNQMKDELLPPFKDKIVFEKLPDFYKYLQELFFLSMYRWQKGDDIDGLNALCSFIEFVRMQINGVTSSSVREIDIIFMELIYSLSCSMKVILTDVSCGKIDLDHLGRALKIYEQIDSSEVKLKELKSSGLYDYYLNMKAYICLRYIRCCNKDSDVFKSAVDYCTSNGFSVSQINCDPLGAARIISIRRVYAYYSSVIHSIGFSPTDEPIINEIREGRKQLESFENFGEPDSKKARLDYPAGM